MSSAIRCVPGLKSGSNQSYDAFGVDKANEVSAFHRSIPGYAPTEMVSLSALARELGVEALYVKDESSRFGLNAFKSLGSSYCVASLISEKLGMPTRYESVVSAEAKENVQGMTLITATDGNHGRRVAWTAKLLGLKSVVLMPKGTALERLQNIQKLGADASITDLVYDDTVKLAAKMAEENNWLLVQDTAWDGYEDIPLRIMQGYLTMALEAVEALPKAPTHLFLQAGVGSMAAAVAAFFVEYYGKDCPKVIVVEPEGANCFYETARAADGGIHPYVGDMHSIMAGLCCGVPSKSAWSILKETADFYVSMPDYVAADGMRILGAPLPGDHRVVSGESGASTFGLTADLLRDKRYQTVKEMLGLNEASRVLCISTEGATDRENYRRIVWDGAWSTCSD